MTSSPLAATVIDMGKRATRQRNAAATTSDAFIDGIVSELRFGAASGVVMMAIPSHEQTLKPLGAKRTSWANKVAERFADLFEGATAQPTTKGIYKSSKRGYLWDDTIIVQSFCDRELLSDRSVLRAVIDLAKEMRSALNQEAVMVVFDNHMMFIKAGQ